MSSALAGFHGLPARAARPALLWALYRPLIRATSSVSLEPEQRLALRDYVRTEWRRNKGLQSEQRAQRKVVEAEQFLHTLRSASHPSYHLDRMRELASYLLARRAASPPPPPRAPAPPPCKPRLRPSVLHSTQYHPPLQRLRPQPLGLSMMIFNRRQAAQKRFDKVVLAKELAGYGRDEDAFETRTGSADGLAGTWGAEWQEWIKTAKQKEAKEVKRNEMRIPSELQAQARQLNKRREQRRVERARQRRAAAP
ncbi:hypothetical protein JCM10213_003840 [Rhodosporidiobolus nylandii]